MVFISECDIEYINPSSYEPPEESSDSVKIKNGLNETVVTYNVSKVATIVLGLADISLIQRQVKDTIGFSQHEQ